MAKFQVSCPNCQTPYHVEDALLGRRARCRLCQTAFILTATGDLSMPSSSPWPWVSRREPGAATVISPGRRAARPPTEDGVFEIWKPGDVILDLYEVWEVFTSGGRGLVYRVRHRGWNVDLAVKCPRLEFFCSEEDK